MAYSYNMGKLFILGYVALLLSSVSGLAQNSYPKCKYSYFKNSKKVSTSQCYDNDDRWGKAKAYDKNGKVIYEAELRRVAGHASVAFSYYPTGALAKAEWHSAPDAGIQWYNTTTWFDQDGNITNVEHNDYDNSPTTTFSPRRPATVPIKQETIKCAAIYVTEGWFINRCSFPVLVTSIRSGQADERKQVTVAPGDTLKSLEYINAEQFADLRQVYAFSAQPALHKHSRRQVLTRWLPPTQPATSVKRYYMVIETLK